MKIYDSANEQKCSFCECKIEAGDDQVVYGTGNSLQYLKVYHPECDEYYSIQKAELEMEYREFLRTHDRGRKEII
jgi:hypothetical protein